MGTTPHTVLQGECLASISDRYGFFWQTLWNHAANADLRSKREDPFTLLPGDVVQIPDKTSKQESRPTDERHRFRLKTTPTRLKLQVLDYKGRPRANVPFTIEVDGKPLSGQSTTDGEGRLERWIPPDAKSGRLIITPGEEEYELYLGHLNPADTTSGVQGRLANLGFYSGPIDGQLSEELEDAIYDYQLARDLKPTGEIDEVTRSRLRQEHGG